MNIPTLDFAAIANHVGEQEATDKIPQRRMRLWESDVESYYTAVRERQNNQTRHPVANVIGKGVTDYDVEV